MSYRAFTFIVVKVWFLIYQHIPRFYSSQDVGFQWFEKNKDLKITEQSQAMIFYIEGTKNYADTKSI